MDIKKRLQKLERLTSYKSQQKSKLIILDDVVTYNNKKFKIDEFRALNPHLQDNDFIEIVYI